MLFRLVYRSRVSRRVRLEDVERIAGASARKNQLRQISGLLVYTPAYFLQVLEGPKPAVLATFERIKRDDRHEEVDVLVESYVTGRLFGEWDLRLSVPKKQLHAETFQSLDGEAALELLGSFR